MSAISMILVVIVAFLAGMEGVLDEFQFHQPLIACTLIGLVTGHLVPCVMLGGSLQMIALGWANIGAAVAPDAALAAVASTIIGVTLALEEDKANGTAVDDVAISGVKVGMMGPLAGVGDPVFWYTARPIIAGLGASMAISGNIVGPILFFLLWNAMRIAFMWYTQEFGYHAGSKITDDVSGGLLQKVTRGAAMMGMFILGTLIERWVTIKFTPVVSKTPLQKGAYIDWSKLPNNIHSVQKVLTEWNMGKGLSLTSYKVTTLQDNLDQLIPGLAGLLLTFLCMWLLKKRVSPIVIIIGLFVLGILGHVCGLL